MIVLQVIVIGLICADAGAAVTPNQIPHAATVVPMTVTVASNGLAA